MAGEYRRERGTQDENEPPLNHIAPITAQALQEHGVAQAQERLKLGLGRGSRGPIFTRADGEPFDPVSLSKAFGRVVVAAGVTPITLHGLRHTHITTLVMDGVAYIPSMQADAALRVDAWLR